MDYDGIRGDILDILRAENRRAIIRVVDSESPMTEDELIGAVADEIGEDPDDVKVSLHHGEIPMLVSWNVLENQGNEIGKGDDFGVVMERLEKLG